jgi:hypothetical protein
MIGLLLALRYEQEYIGSNAFSHMEQRLCEKIHTYML